MLATDMTGSGTPEEKLRWAFRMYDKDNSGEYEYEYKYEQENDKGNSGGNKSPDHYN